jgi:hypothetical protein
MHIIFLKKKGFKKLELDQAEYFHQMVKNKLIKDYQGLKMGSTKRRMGL